QSIQILSDGSGRARSASPIGRSIKKGVRVSSTLTTPSARQPAGCRAATPPQEEGTSVIRLLIRFLGHFEYSRAMADKPEAPIPPLPFLNVDFLKSPGARALRILSEYLEPAERLRKAGIRDTIVFFGSARSLSPEQAAEQLTQVTEEISRAGTVSEELAEKRSHAEKAVRLARYYKDAVELARRLT